MSRYTRQRSIEVDELTRPGEELERTFQESYYAGLRDGRAGHLLMLLVGILYGALLAGAVIFFVGGDDAQEAVPGEVSGVRSDQPR